MLDLRANLYDKLWENMANRDGRVWTFLSFYGAALAFFFGGDNHTELRLLGLPLIFAISIWTIKIVLSAEWWMIRNQMMVVRVELSDLTHFKGIIPKIYQYPSYGPESLAVMSLYVLSIISFVIFLYGLVLLHVIASGVNSTTDGSIEKYLGEIVVIYWPFLLLLWQFGLVWAAVHMMATREKQIDSCWKLALGFQNEHYENAEIPPVTTPNGELTGCLLGEYWQNDRRTQNLRKSTLLVLVLVIMSAVLMNLHAYSIFFPTYIYILIGAFLISMLSYILCYSSYCKWSSVQQTSKAGVQVISAKPWNGLRVFDKEAPAFPRVSACVFFLSFVTALVTCDFWPS
jgi:hypothetical protein